MVRFSVTTNVLLFAYNRPLHLEQTLTQALAANRDSSRKFFVIVDGPKNDRDRLEIDKIIYLLSLFPNVTPIFRKINFGLEKNITLGVTQLMNEFGKLIVLEDDILIKDDFFDFFDYNMNKFEFLDEVASIQGYSPELGDLAVDNYFLRGADCWGWGSWKRNWDLYCNSGTTLLKKLRSLKLLNEFDINNSFPYSDILRGEVLALVESWAIKWHASMFTQNKFSLHPYPSLITNIGFDGSGTNSTDKKILDQFAHKGAKYSVSFPFDSLKRDEEMLIILENFYRSQNHLDGIRKTLYSKKLDLLILLRSYFN
jgi:hypothetical protein